MPKWIKILLSVFILLLAMAFNLVDLFSFDSSKFAMHPQIFGPFENWRSTIVLLRGSCFLAVGPLIVVALFAKKPFFKYYLPAAIIGCAVLFATALTTLEIHYSWDKYVVPQIKMQKLGEGRVGSNKYLEEEICNQSNYKTGDLSLTVKSPHSPERIHPVLDDHGFDTKRLAAGECFKTKVFVSDDENPADISISNGKLAF